MPESGLKLEQEVLLNIICIRDDCADVTDTFPICSLECKSSPQDLLGR